MGIKQTIKQKAVVPVKGTPKNSKCSFYVPNRVLHKDPNVPTVADLASTLCKSFHSSFHFYTNPLVQALSFYILPQNRLKRDWPRDFLLE